jgi:hypothetical protein
MREAIGDRFFGARMTRSAPTERQSLAGFAEAAERGKLIPAIGRSFEQGSFWRRCDRPAALQIDLRDRQRSISTFASGSRADSPRVREESAADCPLSPADGLERTRSRHCLGSSNRTFADGGSADGDRERESEFRVRQP